MIESVFLQYIHFNKTRMMGLLGGEQSLTTCLVVSTKSQCTCVSDGRSHSRTSAKSLWPSHERKKITVRGRNTRTGHFGQSDKSMQLTNRASF